MARTVRKRNAAVSAIPGPKEMGEIMEETSMNYQKEYALLVGQVDRAISILEQYAPGDPIVRKAGDLLISALREAEEHYIEQSS